MIFIKKISQLRLAEKISMIEFDHADLAINAQASLLQLNRSTIYHKHKISNDSELANKIHEIYLRTCLKSFLNHISP
jgi:hypothetical protein